MLNLISLCVVSLAVNYRSKVTVFRFETNVQFEPVFLVGNLALIVDLHGSYFTRAPM